MSWDLPVNFDRKNSNQRMSHPSSGLNLFDGETFRLETIGGQMAMLRS